MTKCSVANPDKQFNGDVWHLARQLAAEELSAGAYHVLHGFFTHPAVVYTTQW